MPTSLTNIRLLEPAERAALERLIEHAKGCTDQSRRVADFLLAWWNAGACGGSVLYKPRCRRNTLMSLQSINQSLFGTKR